MTFKLEKVVPWGRSFEEYCAMFALSTDDLESSILGCGDGPASFNATLTDRGGKVISIDPLYGFWAKEIRQRITETYEEVMEQTRQNQEEFVWRHIPSLKELGRVRAEAMELFLSDYEEGRQEGRYLDASLPSLPFNDGQFDVALCSHFLFLYSGQLSLDFHLRSIRELCRIAREVRIFPLLELGSRKSRHLDAAILKLREEAFEVSLETVPYEFQKGGDQMLRVSSAG
jgi:hypothetical protein